MYNGIMKAVYNKEWLARHLETAEMLERIKARELAGMSDDEAWRQIQLLNTCEAPWRERRDWSGLVEQQALFQRFMRKQA